MIKRYLPFIAAPLLFLGACSTSRLAQKAEQDDDVYYTEAQAKEKEVYVSQQAEKAASPKTEYVTDEQLYGGSEYTDSYDRYDNYYDRNYSARINRFRNYSPWRSYYDSWYDYSYDPFYNNSFYSYNYYSRPTFGIYVGIGRPSWYYNPWGYNNGYSRYWGPYAYYNPFLPYNPYYGGYGNGYYGGGYYGGNYYGGGLGRPAYNNPNYRSRPNRETDNVNGPGNSRILDRNPGSVISRPERYRPDAGSNGTVGNSQPQRTETRPSRPARSGDGSPLIRSNDGQNGSGRSSAPAQNEPSRPQREAPPQRTESRPAERSQPSAPSPSSSEKSSGSSSRPTRGGN